MEKSEVDELLKLVDEFIAILKKDLLSIQVPAKGFLPGVWDKMKNWWHNFTKKQGANDPENPYVFRNKFGALGVPKSEIKQTKASKDFKDGTGVWTVGNESKRMSLSQYKFIREQYENLEKDLSILSEETIEDSENIKKLKLFKIIDDWANKFKKAIEFKLLSGNTSSSTPQETQKDNTATAADETESSAEDSISSGIVRVPGAKPNLPQQAVVSSTAKAVKEAPAPTPTSKTEDEESLGAGRPGKGLIINWSGRRLCTRKKINGVTKIISVNTENLIPISVLRTKNKKEIEKLETSAENNIKLSIYEDLIKHLPGETRQRAGQDDNPLYFNINEDDYDKEFKNAFKIIVNKISNEHKEKERTKGNALHKQLVKDVYRILDEKFNDRAERYDIEKLNRYLQDALSDIES